MNDKIFEKFKKSANKELAPFFTIVAYLERSTKYSIFVKKRKIKKFFHLSMYVGRLFARLFFVLLETKDLIIDFCLLNNRPLPKEKEWENLSLLKQLCIQYIEIIEFFEKGCLWCVKLFFILY